MTDYIPDDFEIFAPGFTYYPPPYGAEDRAGNTPAHPWNWVTPGAAVVCCICQFHSGLVRTESGEFACSDHGRES